MARAAYHVRGLQSGGGRNEYKAEVERVRGAIAELAGELASGRQAMSRGGGGGGVAGAVLDAVEGLDPSSAEWAGGFVGQLAVENGVLVAEAERAEALLSSPPEGRGKERSRDAVRVRMGAMVEALVEEMDIVRGVVGEQIEGLESEVLLQRGILEERRAVGRMLQAQIEDRRGDHGVGEEDEALEELVARRENELSIMQKAAQGYTQWLGDQLKAFMGHAYPPVVRPEIQGYWDSLEDTVAELLAPIIDTSIPSSYIAITPNMYEPYIELLIRAGVVEKHPRDPQRIRLVQFHQ